MIQINRIHFFIEIYKLFYHVSVFYIKYFVKECLIHLLPHKLINLVKHLLCYFYVVWVLILVWSAEDIV